MVDLKHQLIHKGASLVGFGNIQSLYHNIDSDKSQTKIPEYPIGISIALAIPKEVIKGITLKPTIEYYNEYNSLNKRLDALAEFCEQYLIESGYKAFAQTIEKTTYHGVFETIMPHKTIAVRSGIGWIGKSALLVTPEYGSAVRLTSVLTDAPLITEQIIYTTRCSNCNICKNACPGEAITGELWDATKERDWIYNALACRMMARKISAQALEKEITLCGKCIEVCPYTQKYLMNK